MAKKQFIRHLEFYGFPDQNTYASEVNGVDLSEIIEKNKEQDKEIEELTDDKAAKKDLDELSGTVESLITAQTEINQGFSNAISGITNDVNALKEADNEFAEQIDAVTSAVTNLMEDVEILDENVEELNEAVSGISDDIADISGDVETLKETVSGLSEDVQSIKDDLQENYPKKDDVYTKDEIDEMVASGFSGYATVEWVEAQGYITEEEADAKYATVTEIGDVVETISALSNSIVSLSGDVESFENETNEKIDNINDAIDNLVDSFDEQISAITDSISDIEEELDTKADVDAFNELAETVSGMSEELATKATKRELDETRTELQDGIDALEESKADKTDLEAVSGAVNSLDEKLDAEIARSTEKDNEHDTKINELGAIVESAVTKVESYETRVADLETGLAQEILDRQQADLDLIGTSADPKTADTIWGAKNFAKSMKSEAISESNIYTDEKVAVFQGELDNLHNWAEQNFSSGASKEWVNQRLNETEEEIETEFNTALQSEKNRASGEETRLWIAVNENKDSIRTNTAEIAHNATRIGSITEWDGSLETVDQYDDSGNGVLDVLHREFHEFEKTIGTIKDITYEDGNIVITYYTKEGEKQAIIPISEILILDNYYTKEETNALIEEAISQLHLDDYYTKEETDDKIAESVSGIDGHIDAIEEQVNENTSAITDNASAITNIIEKLGYDNNETLVTNNEHEVAFGEYNISNTSEEASGQTIFSIGNGTDDENRSNAVEVRKNGDVYLLIEGEMMCINKLLGMLAHEVYDDDN